MYYKLFLDIAEQQRIWSYLMLMGSAGLTYATTAYLRGAGAGRSNDLFLLQLRNLCSRHGVRTMDDSDFHETTPIHIFESIGTAGIFALTADETGANLPGDGAGWVATGIIEAFAQVRDNTPPTLVCHLRQRGFFIVESKGE